MRRVLSWIGVCLILSVAACDTESDVTGADAGTGTDTTDTTDGTDSDDTTDGTDSDDATDGTDADDATDGTDSDDATDGTDSDDATDGTDGSDSTDGSDGTDACTPSCTGKQCGDDGCGGSCGTCPLNAECNASGGCDLLSGACTNETDFAIIVETNIVSSATACAPGCIGQPSPDCSAACVEADTGLSATCSECIGVFADCALQSCGLQCLTGTPAECLTCAKASCGLNFQQCAGIAIPDPPECTPSCEGKTCGGDGCGGSCGTCPGGACLEDNACGPLPVEACLNAEDEAVLETADLAAAGQDCALGCLSAGDPTACVGSCIKDATGLSYDCSWCGGQFITCIAGFCLTSCFDPTSQGCLDCQATNCNTPFTECTGLPAPGACTPECEGKTCGGDGCGGVCGLCGDGEICGLDQACVALEPDACDNPTDATAISSFDAIITAQTCTVQCGGAGDLQACISGCIATESAISISCAFCVAGAATCTLENCFNPCLNITSTECTTCQATSCGADFAACAGVPLPEPPVCEPTCGDKVCGPNGCGGSCGECDGQLCSAAGTCVDAEPLACTSEEDATIFAGGSVFGTTLSCVSGCYGQSGVDVCTSVCVETELALTTSCSACLGTLAACGIDACTLECLGDEVEPCATCVEAACGTDFTTCSGVSVPAP